MHTKIARLEEAMDYAESNSYASDELHKLYAEESVAYDRLEKIDEIIHQIETIKKERYLSEFIQKRKV